MTKQRARERKKKRQRELLAIKPYASPDEVQPGDYTVVDRTGRVHPLGPEIFGDDWPSAQKLLSEIDRSKLPSVEKAQRKQMTQSGVGATPGPTLRITMTKEVEQKMQAEADARGLSLQEMMQADLDAHYAKMKAEGRL
jgi:hypothetical protein